MLYKQVDVDNQIKVLISAQTILFLCSIFD